MKKLPLSVPALAGLALLAACGSDVTQATPDAATGSTPSTVTIENCGEERTYPVGPTAVVGMAPAQTELVVRLGAVDALAGQAQTAMAPLPDDVATEVADVPVVSEDTPPAREDLLAVGPDLVLSPTGYEFTAEQGFASLEQLDRAGAAAYVATGGCLERRMTGTVDDLLVDLDNLGAVLDREAEAAELAEQAEAELAAVDEAVEGLEQPRVAQLYVEGDTISAIGAGIEPDMVARAGGESVYSPDEDAFADFFAATVNPEDVASRDPEVIVFAVADEAAAEEVEATLRRTFPDVPAVRDDRLVAVDQADTFPGSLGNVRLVRQMAEAFHPDAF
ncbi:ABC transporter substrate-binding protein [uncultured Nocardioides sp.]|uniref:ABC transporter substrate-binding protein n=1 Tax=uncultured Nocardioides sp. TaxID=198441 RepID=UPI00260C4F65|nr:ABC transporter substrate-binding protein [uncultured Nocardioides sp.]